MEEAKKDLVLQEEKDIYTTVVYRRFGGVVSRVAVGGAGGSIAARAGEGVVRKVKQSDIPEYCGTKLMHLLL